MSYYMFLDDERFPVDTNAVIVRSYAEAVQYVERNGAPLTISFDYDLGPDETAYDFVKWLVQRDMDRPGTIPPDFRYHIHSANPVGRENIRGYLDGYLAFRRGE